MYECRFNPVFQEVICLHKQFVRLAGKSCYDIYSEKDLRLQSPVRVSFSGDRVHPVSDIFDFTCEEFRIVMPSDILQYGVASALERDVEMWLELGAGGDPIHHLIRQQVRFDG